MCTNPIDIISLEDEKKNWSEIACKPHQTDERTKWKKKVSPNWLNQLRLLMGPSHIASHCERVAIVCARLMNRTVRIIIITATNSNTHRVSQSTAREHFDVSLLRCMTCTYFACLNRIAPCVCKYRIVHSIFFSSSLSVHFCSFFSKNTWIRLSRLLFSSLIWWFLWPSRSYCHLLLLRVWRAVVVAVGISLLDTNCTIEQKLHYFFSVFFFDENNTNLQQSEDSFTSFLDRQTYRRTMYAIGLAHKTLLVSLSIT